MLSLEPSASFIPAQYHHQSPGLDTKLHYYKTRLIHKLSLPGRVGDFENNVFGGSGLYSGVSKHPHSYRAYQFLIVPHTQVEGRGRNPRRGRGAGGGSYCPQEFTSERGRGNAGAWPSSHAGPRGSGGMPWMCPSPVSLLGGKEK